MLGRAWASATSAAIARGAAASSTADPVAAATTVRGRDLVTAVLTQVTPLLLLIGAAALLAQVAQTRGLWLPRRAGRRLPPPADGVARRAGAAALDLTRGLAVAAVLASVLVSSALVLADHAGASAASTGRLAATLLGLLLAHAAAVAVALGVIDWLERARQVRADLAMSARDLRDERRETEGDPRWRRERRNRASVPDEDEGVRRSLVVLVSDDLAVALAWHPRWQPVPLVTARGRARAAIRIAALARRHHIAIHRAPTLAAALGALDPGRLVPDRMHGEVARVVVAIEGRGR